MKRLICLLLLLAGLSFCAGAVGIRIDGHVSDSEYNQTATVLIPQRHESNNDVSSAYVLWTVSAADYSVYVGVRYVCDDVSVLLEQQSSDEEPVTEPDKRPAMTGIELGINGSKCLTAWLDGTVTDMNDDQYDADVAFQFYRSKDSDDPELNTFDGEIRLGIKRWIPHDSELTIRILDCKGVPSNYYRLTIYPSPTETEASASLQRAATESAAAQSDTSVAAAASAAVPRAARPIITAASGTMAVSTSRPPSTAPEKSETAAKTTAVRSTAPKETRSAAPETTSAAPRQEAAVTEREEITASEPLTTVENSTAAAIVPQRYWTMRKLKLIGASSAAALVTGAVMIAVFAGIRKPPNAPPDDPVDLPVPPEEDDF